MSRTPDSSQYLACIRVLMEAGARVAGVLSVEHVQRFFKEGNVARWNTEEENAVILNTFWRELMNPYLDLGAVGFPLIEEVRGICASLSIDSQELALREGYRLIQGGTRSYDFENNLWEYKSGWAKVE
jgi:hypothetical protein